MAMGELELHLKLVNVCSSGEVSKLASLVSTQETDVKTLIKGNVAHVYKSKYGKYRPGDYVYVACEYGFPEIVHYLLHLGGDGNNVCTSVIPAQTPMIVACQKGNVEVIKVLHSNNIALHPKCKFKDSPVYYCARYGKLDILKYIVSNERGILIKTTGGDIGTCPCVEYTDIWASLTKISGDTIVIGRLLLYIGCIQKHLEIVKYLVSEGVSPQVFLPKASFFADTPTPLSAACKNEDEDMAAFLLHKKAELPESTVEYNPEFTGKLLSRYNESYRRSHSVSMNSGKDCFTPVSPIAVYWVSMGLHKLHLCWFESEATRICRVDISGNKITTLPCDFFKLLVNLEEVDLSSNKLTGIPSEGLEKTRLRKVIACNNNITAVPLELFMNPTIFRIDLTSNKITFLPPDINSEETTSLLWNCPSLKCLRCSKNTLANVPKALQGAINLEKLYLNKNKLQKFEIYWKCPLMDLDLSSNDLKQFASKSHEVWSKTLQKLNLADNNLNALSSNICMLENLQDLNVSYNHLKTLPPPRYWMAKILSKLDLSNNVLTASVNIQHPHATGTGETSSGTCEFPEDLFGNCLQILDLSHNCLEIVPPSLCKLKSLTELNLGDNPKIVTLPNELGKLKNITSLKLNNLKIEKFPLKLDNKNHAKTVLPYLRGKLRQFEPFNRMKLMVVGLQRSGKTTLIATLQGKKPPENIATNGVNVEQWSLNKRTSSLPFFWSHVPDSDIIFSSWDLAGQYVYYATHQCFLTGKTLYLAVFNTLLGTGGVDDLESWLLNIQARAPDSKVIIVGTHIDLIPGTKSTVLGDLKTLIYSKYRKQGFPSLCGCVFVSNIKGEGLPFLKEEIIKVATSIISDESYGGNVGAVRTAPRSYIQLYNSVVKESEKRRKENKLPILTTDEMLELAKGNPDNDIIDVEELFSAAAFLHENGILLHYDDHLRELNNYFFIDPPWLCRIMASVVTVTERNSHVLGGKISRTNLIKSSNLTEEFIHQYLQLLERFEIVLCLNETTFLVPCMLPKERPSVLAENDKLEYGKDHYITRNYHMGYIPPGFWSRLIARIIIAVRKWGIVPSATNYENVARDSMDEYLTIWREGIIVFYTHGCFLVEYFEDEVKYERNHNKGVAICIWSENDDFSTMGFIVDHLDSLILEWYPGLHDVDGYGNPVVQKLIPCPTCSMKLQQENSTDTSPFRFIEGFNANFRNPALVRQFDLSVCAIAAENYMSIRCYKHEDEVVPLNKVVPDLLMTDLPSRYVIKPDAFEFEPCEEMKLGEGGAGFVYEGRYEGNPVAIKQSHSSNKSFDTSSYRERVNSKVNSIFNPRKQTIEEQLEGTKVIKAFWDLRQEVAVLCRLQHRNIVKFIGVSHSPLCFVLELAPLGSLWNVLIKKRKEMEQRSKESGTNVYKDSVLGTSMTHKIALQVAHALEYLHESKIIYRDLKSDNVLVWSIEEDDVINVKLSDYGISAFATPQGVIGVVGTPGYLAPEVRRSIPYDAKVDIFSYGIWLYELMSGRHPFEMYRSSMEMKKAIMRDERPELRDGKINPGVPYLELLMKDCWQRIARCRPTSSEVVSRLECVDVGMLRHVFPMHDSCTLSKVRCIIPLHHINQGKASEMEGSYILVWYGDDNGRRYCLINLQEEKIDIDVPSPGPRVTCAACVDNLLWLGTDGKLEIMSFLSMKSAGDWKLSLLWTVDLKAHCMDLLIYENKISGLVSIFASLANCTLMVFRKSEVDQNCNIQDSWAKSQVIHLLNENRPAKCLCLTRDESELWVSSGDMIVIINPDTLEIMDSVKTFWGEKCLIYLMVTNNKYVWISEWNLSTIIQVDVRTRTAKYKFLFRCANLLNHNVVFNISTEGSFDEEDTPSAGRNASSPTTAFGSFSSLSSLEEAQPGSSFSDEENCSLNSNSLMKVSLCRKPSLCEVDDYRSRKKINTRPVLSRSRGVKTFKITSLMHYDGVLWIGRSSGDIILVDVNSVAPDNSPESEGFGDVIAQLGGSVGYEDYQRTVSCILPIGNNQMLSSVRLNTSNLSRRSNHSIGPDSYQLLVFQVWSRSQLETYHRCFNK